MPAKGGGPNLGRAGGGSTWC